MITISSGCRYKLIDPLNPPQNILLDKDDSGGGIAVVTKYTLFRRGLTLNSTTYLFGTRKFTDGTKNLYSSLIFSKLDYCCSYITRLDHSININRYFFFIITLVRGCEFYYHFFPFNFEFCSGSIFLRMRAKKVASLLELI